MPPGMEGCERRYTRQHQTQQGHFHGHHRKRHAADRWFLEKDFRFQHTTALSMQKFRSRGDDGEDVMDAGRRQFARSSPTRTSTRVGESSFHAAWPRLLCVWCVRSRYPWLNKKIESRNDFFDAINLAKQGIFGRDHLLLILTATCIFSCCRRIFTDWSSSSSWIFLRAIHYTNPSQKAFVLSIVASIIITP